MISRRELQQLQQLQQFQQACIAAYHKIEVRLLITAILFFLAPPAEAVRNFV